MRNTLRGLLLLGVLLIVPACGASHGIPVVYPGLWARTYGASLGDLAGSFGEVAVLGSSYAVAGVYQNNSAWVLRLGLDGSVLWQKTYGTGTVFTSIAAVPAGGLIASGSTSTMGAGGSDVWVVRLAEDGSVLWQKTYGGTGNEYGYRIRVTADGGFVLLCNSGTFSGGVANLWILKLNADGSVAWQKTYITPLEPSWSDIAEIPGGGYLVSSGESFGANFQDAWVLRLNSDGSIQWQNRYGTTAGEGMLTGVPTIDGGFLLVGESNAPGGAGTMSLWILKLNGTGTIAWQKTYGTTGQATVPFCHAQPDGSFLLSGWLGPQGSSGSQAWALHLLADGSVDWQRKYGPVSGGQESYALTPSPFGGLLLLGNTSTYGAGSYDLWVLHLNDDGTCPPLDATTSVTSANTAVSPVATTFVAANTTITPSNTAVTPTDTFAVSTSQAP